VESVRKINETETTTNAMDEPLRIETIEAKEKNE